MSKSTYALQDNNNNYIVVTQSWTFNASTTPLTKRPKELLREDTVIAEPVCECVLENKGASTVAGKDKYEWNINATDTWLNSTISPTWVATQDGASTSGSTNPGTGNFVTGETLQVVATATDSLLQVKTATARIAGSIVFGLGEIRFSEIAKRGGELFYRYPGDYNSYLWRKGGDQTMVGADGWRGWRYGYCKGGDRVPIWMDGSDKYIRDNWGPQWMFAKPSDTSQSDGTDTDNVHETSYGAPWISSHGELHPGHSADGQVLINLIRWRPPYNGTIRTTGMYFDADSGEQANGVNVWLALMNGVDPNATIANWKTQVFAENSANETYYIWDQTIEVTTNQVFYLAIGPNSDSSYDTTHLGLNFWYVDFDTTNQGAPANIDVSLRENLEDHCAHKICLPNYYNGTQNMQALAYKTTTNNGTVKASHYKSSFMAPDLVRTDESRDTKTGAGNGNGFLTIQALNPPSADAVIKYRLNRHISNQGLTLNYDKTNIHPNTVTSDSTLSYTFGSLTGGLYQFAVIINSASLGISNFDTSSSTPAPGGVWVERGLIGYTK